jgi:hypothetical protein
VVINKEKPAIYSIKEKSAINLKKQKPLLSKQGLFDYQHITLLPSAS